MFLSSLNLFFLANDRNGWIIVSKVDRSNSSPKIKPNNEDKQDIIDDLEQALENAYEWYTSGPRQRLQPGASIVLVMTRWSTKDLTAKLLKAQNLLQNLEDLEVPSIHLE